MIDCTDTTVAQLGYDHLKTTCTAADFDYPFDSMVKVPLKCPMAAPQLGSCASSGRAWRLWLARSSQGEAQPLGVSPLPGVLE